MPESEFYRLLNQIGDNYEIYWYLISLMQTDEACNQ